MKNDCEENDFRLFGIYTRSFMRLAQVYDLSEKQRKILIDIINEPKPDNIDDVFFDKQTKKIDAVFNELLPVFYNRAFQIVFLEVNKEMYNEQN